MSKILSIDENKTWIRRGYPSLMAGIEVVTAEEIWFARIDDKASCCETWGTIVLNDEDTAYFVGADLISVEVVDTALNTKKLKEADISVSYGGIMFVNFVTSKGVMQFVLYNEHNGYYGHDAHVGKMVADVTTILHSDTL